MQKESLRAIECKLYDSTLGVMLGRTFMGLVVDCGTLGFKAFVTNGHCAGLSKYFRPQSRPDRYFGLSPTDQDEEAGFVKVVRQNLRKWSATA